MKKYGIIIACLLAGLTSIAQSVGVGTTTPENSAQLDVTSTTKGMLVPRMTDAERIAIFEPATSLIVYQTTAPAGFYYNAGTPLSPSWVLLINSANAVTNVTATTPIVSSGGTTPNLNLPGTSGAVLYGNGAGSAFNTVGSPGQFLVSNGSSAPSWSILGQTGTTVYGTASVTVTNATFTAIPTLTQTISVPSNAVVYISTTGGVLCNTTVTTGFSIVDIVIYIDGAEAPHGGFRRLHTINTTSVVGVIENWAMSIIPVLSAGSHTISVQARLAGGNTTAVVSGDTNSVLQGTLSVLILKQ